MIKGIDTTISANVGSDNINVDIIFLKKLWKEAILKKLWAEAKGLREANKIVCDKLKELTKEEENVAQEK